MASQNSKLHLTKQSVNRKQSASATMTKPHSPRGKPQTSTRPATVPATNTRILQCSSCKRSFSNHSELSQHQRDKHGPGRPSSSKSATIPFAASKRGEGKLCRPVYTGPSSTSSKLQQLPGKGCLLCSQCKRSFSTKDHLLQHQRDAHQVKQPNTSHSAAPPTSLNNQGVSCSWCSRSFSTKDHLLQHQRDAHQVKQPNTSHSAAPPASLNKQGVSCSLCSRSFSTNDHLLQHQRDAHQVKQPNTSHSASSPASLNKQGVSCSLCSRSFSTAAELSQHRKDKHNIPIPPSTGIDQRGKVICSICSRSFSTHNELLQHTKDKHQAKQHGSPFYTTTEIKTSNTGSYSCHTCSKCFSTYSQLSQHQADKHKANQTDKPKLTVATTGVRKRSHEVTNNAAALGGLSPKQKTDLLRNKRKKNIDEFYASKVDIDKDEKKASVKLVDDTLFKIMSHVKHQKGGDIYCPNHIKAGSYPVNTKIGKADEFDTNICLKLGQKDVNVRRNGKINYAYPQSEHSTNMNVKCQLDETRKGVKIPEGNAVASVCGGDIPDTLRHGSDLIPREMRYDLYHKIKVAMNELHLNHVDLSRDTHGPALTMTIHPDRRSTIKHDISVDITLSLPCDVPITNWPRKETRKAFSEKLIYDVKDTGTHLVPKKDEFWSVSYSRAERELFSKIDEGNGCRKFVYKMLKKHLQTCKSRSSSGLPGMSSHILKTQLLWSCEKRTTPGYWHHDNVICALSILSLILRKHLRTDVYLIILTKELTS